MIARPTDDEIVFGKDFWVYCSQHMKPHKTGSCGVTIRHKLGLGVATAQQALEKCRAFNLPIADETQEAKQ